MSMRKSATKWDQFSECAFIEVWNSKVEQLRGCRKNSHILKQMVADLEKRGFKYTHNEVKTKMHNMTTRYRKEKLISKKSGFPSEWEPYDQMHWLLSQYNSNDSDGLAVDSIKNMSVNSVSDPLSPLPPPISSPQPSLLSSPRSQRSSSRRAQSSSPVSVISSPSLLTLNAGKSKKNDLEETFFKSILENMQTLQDDIRSSTERMIAIEEERVRILKAYVDKEAAVQNALVRYLNSN